MAVTSTVQGITNKSPSSKLTQSNIHQKNNTQQKEGFFGIGTKGKADSRGEETTHTSNKGDSPKDLTEKALEKLGISPKMLSKEDFKMLKKLFNKLYKAPDHREVHIGEQMAIISCIKFLLGLKEVLFRVTKKINGLKLEWLVPNNSETNGSGDADVMYTYNSTVNELVVLKRTNALRKERLT